MEALTETERESITKQIGDQFNQLVSAINQKDACAWSEHYSKDGFLAAFAGGVWFPTRSAWIAAITGNFATRESQCLKPLMAQISPLTPDIAVMTSQQKIEMRLKGDGQTRTFNHVYTLLWRKENNGWKIVHSHESWVDDQAE